MEEKLERALKLLKGWPWRGREIIQDIIANSDPAVLESMSIEQLVLVLSNCSRSYKTGRDDVQKFTAIKDDCLWVGGKIQKTIPLYLINRLECIEQRRIEEYQLCGTQILPGNFHTTKVHDYTVDRWSISDDYGRKTEITWGEAKDEASRVVLMSEDDNVELTLENI